MPGRRLPPTGRGGRSQAPLRLAGADLGKRLSFRCAGEHYGTVSDIAEVGGGVRASDARATRVCPPMVMQFLDQHSLMPRLTLSLGRTVLLALGFLLSGVGTLSSSAAEPGSSAAEPKKILLLHSYGPETAPYD